MNNVYPEESLYFLGVKAAIINDRGQMLALNITRKNSEETYWDLPGGRIADDESPEGALKREVKEETGIDDVEVISHLGLTMTGVKLALSDDKKAGIIFSVYVCRTSTDVTIPEERITTHWLPVSEVIANLKTNPDWPVEMADSLIDWQPAN